jgi:hypothetical protein
MKQSGRVAFHRNTYERHAKKYQNKGKLPAEGTMYVNKGRPVELANPLLVKNDTGGKYRTVIASAEILKRRRLVHGEEAKAAHRTTCNKYAAAAKLPDDSAHENKMINMYKKYFTFNKICEQAHIRELQILLNMN